MPTRVANLETDVKWMRRVGYAVIAAATVAMLGTWSWGDSRFDKMDTRVVDVQKGQAEQVATLKALSDNVLYIRDRLDNHSDAQPTASAPSK